MGLTGSAEHDLPAKAWKPGEFAGWFTAWRNSRRLMKTAQYKGDTCGIEKSVFVSIIHLQRLIPVGDDGITDRAENSLVGRLCRGVIGTGNRRSGGLRRQEGPAP